MDSLTQFVLGAAVATACLGKTVGPRKAALIGGVLGTVPDLDVFIPFDDPIDTFVYHRGWTHSVFVHALAAPVFGEVLVRLFKGLRDRRWLVYPAVYLCFVTHAIIDAMTVYGTRIFWPFYPDPVGVGSVFIIDPVYSLPLLGIVVWAFFKGQWSRGFGRGLAVVLILTSSYMGVSAVIQRQVESHAYQVFEDEGIRPERIYAMAAPFNIALWKVIGLENDRYHNLYVSLLDKGDGQRIYSHPRRTDLVACLHHTPAFQKLDWFSRGYFRAEQIDDKIVMSDLRMGLTPGYAFRFEIGEFQSGEIKEMPPVRAARLLSVDDGDLNWLWARIQGKPHIRKAEVASQANVVVADTAACGVPPVMKAG